MYQIFKQLIMLICFAATLMLFNFILRFYITSKLQLFLQYPLLSATSPHYSQSTKVALVNYSNYMQITNDDPHQNLKTSTNDGDRFVTNSTIKHH